MCHIRNIIISVFLCLVRTGTAAYDLPCPNIKIRSWGKETTKLSLQSSSFWTKIVIVNPYSTAMPAVGFATSLDRLVHTVMHWEPDGHLQAFSFSSSNETNKIEAKGTLYKVDDNNTVFESFAAVKSLDITSLETREKIGISNTELNLDPVHGVRFGMVYVSPDGSFRIFQTCDRQGTPLR